MAQVTIDVKALPDIIHRAMRALQPGPNVFRSDWGRTQQTLDDLYAVVELAQDNPLFGTFIALSLEEARLILPYLEADGT